MASDEYALMQEDRGTDRFMPAGHKAPHSVLQTLG